MPEYKSMPSFIKGIEGRTITGICAVFGNIDSGGDRLFPGAFSKTLQERRAKIRHLWQHGADGWDYFVTPPIAKIDDIYEVGRDALPEKCLKYAPEASGGLEVKRTYLTTPRGEEILTAYQQGIELEMSFGYDAIKRDFETLNSGQYNETYVRNLREVKLWDTSDVNWGMNEAAMGSKSHERHLSVLMEKMQQLEEEIKAGRLEESDLLKEFRAVCAKFSQLTTGKEGQHGEELKSDPVLPVLPVVDSSSEQPKEESRAEETQPEPTAPLVKLSLTPSLIRLQELELELLR